MFTTIAVSRYDLLDALMEHSRPRPTEGCELAIVLQAPGQARARQLVDLASFLDLPLPASPDDSYILLLACDEVAGRRLLLDLPPSTPYAELWRSTVLLDTTNQVRLGDNETGRPGDRVMVIGEEDSIFTIAHITPRQIDGHSPQYRRLVFLDDTRGGVDPASLRLARSTNEYELGTARTIADELRSLAATVSAGSTTLQRLDEAIEQAVIAGSELWDREARAIIERAIDRAELEFTRQNEQIPSRRLPLPGDNRQGYIQTIALARRYRNFLRTYGTPSEEEERRSTDDPQVRALLNLLADVRGAGEDVVDQNDRRQLYELCRTIARHILDLSGAFYSTDLLTPNRERYAELNETRRRRAAIRAGRVGEAQA